MRTITPNMQPVNDGWIEDLMQEMLPTEIRQHSEDVLLRARAGMLKDDDLLQIARAMDNLCEAWALGHEYQTMKQQGVH